MGQVCLPGSAGVRPACLEALCLAAATNRVPVSACTIWYVFIGLT